MEYLLAAGQQKQTPIRNTRQPKKTGQLRKQGNGAQRAKPTKKQEPKTYNKPNTSQKDAEINVDQRKKCYLMSMKDFEI